MRELKKLIKKIDKNKIKLQSAILILHRKVDSKRLCICGSKLELVNSNWICRTQYLLGQPKAITVYIPEIPQIKSAIR